MKIPPYPLVLLAVALPTPVLAHHGTVTNPLLYLSDELAELEGELTEVFWRNPHTRARLSVADEDGGATIWELEFAPWPRHFELMGLAPEDFLGPVRVAGYISRQHPDSLGVVNFLLPDGREYVQGRTAELRWSSERLDTTRRAPDAASVQAAEAAADGIFRTWNGRIGAPVPVEVGLASQTLTERGRELTAAYNPLTDNGQLSCRHGMPDTMFDPHAMEISDEGGTIRIHSAQFNIRRTIHMNAEAVSEDPEASPVGYSTGRWEGNELVVTTTHVDWPYYSNDGTPQSDQVQYLERFSASEDGQRLNYSITIEDPVIFTEPFTLDRFREAAPGVEIEPFDCVLQWQESGG